MNLLAGAASAAAAAAATGAKVSFADPWGGALLFFADGILSQGKWMKAAAAAPYDPFAVLLGKRERDGAAGSEKKPESSDEEDEAAAEKKQEEKSTHPSSSGAAKKGKKEHKAK